MSTYRSTQKQRDAVQALRDQYPQLHTLTAPAVWRVCEAMRADVDASLSVDEHIAATALIPAPEVTPAHVEEPTAVVEYGAAEFLIALDAESMVARGLTKFDTDALSEAHAALAKYLQPGTTTPILRYDLATLAKQARDAMGNLRPDQAQALAVKKLDDMCSKPVHRVPSPITLRNVPPLFIDLGCQFDDDDETSGQPPLQFVLCYTTPGSVAQAKRGEEIWMVAHQPVWTPDRRYPGQVEPSRWLSQGSTFLGVVATFRSSQEALAVFDELFDAMSTVRRITEAMAGGDPRYTDDPVRTQGVQLDVRAEYQNGPQAASFA